MQNIFVGCTIKCSKALPMYKWQYCILRSLWKHLKQSKSQQFSTICSLWTMHQIILHDFPSGGRKVAPHNAVSRGTAWCIISPNSSAVLAYRTVKLVFIYLYIHVFSLFSPLFFLIISQCVNDQNLTQRLIASFLNTSDINLFIFGRNLYFYLFIKSWFIVLRCTAGTFILFLR